METNYNKKSLQKNYLEAYTDPQFQKLIKRLNIKDEQAMKYTSSLKESVNQLHNCQDCPGLIYCKNEVEGHVMYPECYQGQINFIYRACKYKKEQLAKEENKITMDKDIFNAKMSDIQIDKERKEVIKWLKNFYDTYEKNSRHKGLYLHGNFGCGKTYLISALFNELSKKRITSEIVYYPELLRELKSDFDSSADHVEYLQDVDLLLIDDIGAEKVSEWNRDEILGTILQKRMNNYKTTFFTSNLDLSALETHLRLNSNVDDEMNAKRIIERIKQLTDDIELIGENKRK